MTEPITAAGDDQPWRWHLERACAVVGAFVIPVHLITVLVVNDPATWSAAALSSRWQTPLWRVVDALALSVALIHGLGALRRRVQVRSRILGVVLDVVLVAGLTVVALASLRYRVVS